MWFTSVLTMFILFMSVMVHKYAAKNWWVWLTSCVDSGGNNKKEFYNTNLDQFLLLGLQCFQICSAHTILFFIIFYSLLNPHYPPNFSSSSALGFSPCTTSKELYLSIYRTFHFFSLVSDAFLVDCFACPIKWEFSLLCMLHTNLASWKKKIIPTYRSFRNNP